MSFGKEDFDDSFMNESIRSRSSLLVNPYQAGDAYNSLILFILHIQKSMANIVQNLIQNYNWTWNGERV